MMDKTELAATRSDLEAMVAGRKSEVFSLNPQIEATERHVADLRLALTEAEASLHELLADQHAALVGWTKAEADLTKFLRANRLR